MSEMQARMAALQELNLAIVAARKRGEHEEVKRLKAQVGVLLAGGAPAAPKAAQAPSAAQAASAAKAPTPPPKETPQPKTPPPTAPNSPPVTRTDPPNAMAIMRELSVVNQQIVEARKAGKEEQVKRLQKRAESLMAMGIGE